MSVQSSVSLQHLPYDVKLEKKLPSEIESRLSFATQKLKEIVDAAAQAPKLKDEDIKAGLPVCESFAHMLPLSKWWTKRLGSACPVCGPLLSLVPTQEDLRGNLPAFCECSAVQRAVWRCQFASAAQYGNALTASVQAICASASNLKSREML